MGGRVRGVWKAFRQGQGPGEDGKRASQGKERVAGKCMRGMVQEFEGTRRAVGPLQSWPSFYARVNADGTDRSGALVKEMLDGLEPLPDLPRDADELAALLQGKG